MYFFLVLFLASVLVVVAAALFPVGGGITIAAYALFYFFLFEPYMSKVNSLIAVMVFLIPGTVIFLVSMSLENSFAQHQMYRRLRYLWRLAGVTFITYIIAVMTSDARGRPIVSDASAGGGLSIDLLLTLVVGIVVAHFLSWRLDRSYAGKTLSMSHAFAAREPIPKFETQAFEENDEEVRRRQWLLWEALHHQEASNRGDSPKADQLRHDLQNLADLLAYRERKRQGLEAQSPSAGFSRTESLVLPQWDPDPTPHAVHLLEQEPQEAWSNAGAMPQPTPAPRRHPWFYVDIPTLILSVAAGYPLGVLATAALTGQGRPRRDRGDLRDDAGLRIHPPADVQRDRRTRATPPVMCVACQCQRE